jgi:2'-hydroxyisoflavone reductase
MTTSLLVLGGSGFVGRAAVLEAVARGWSVTTFNRGTADPPPPIGGTESAPTVPAAPDATDGEYPDMKRGAELAVQQVFSDRGLLARAGTILGPYEDVGRLTWWLARMARGGEVLCPGPPGLELQFVDARDLAGFVIDAASAGHSGPFNVVTRRWSRCSRPAGRRPAPPARS